MDKELKNKLEQSYLDKYIFYGLTNLNDGFDAEAIKYFSEKEFEIVLERIQSLGLGIYGIEPWKDGEYYGVDVCESHGFNQTNPSWYLASYEMFKKKGEILQYSATYYIPNNLLVE